MDSDKPWLSTHPVARAVWLGCQHLSPNVDRAVLDLWSALDEARRERDAARAEVERLHGLFGNILACIRLGPYATDSLDACAQIARAALAQGKEAKHG